MGNTWFILVLVVLFDIALGQDYLYIDNEEESPAGEAYTDGLIDFEYHEYPRNAASDDGKVSKRMYNDANIFNSCT